ncbi:MaoC family dehydratase [Thetidibacter halocola]|nr:MaoC family dehydratase [Thetidibacter halocola]
MMAFEDFPLGHRFTTSTVTLTEEAIIAFAQANDPQPFHLDAEAAKESPYGGIIASGFQTMIEAFKLTLAEGGWADASMGSPGMEEVRWILPVRPGDTLHVEAEVLKSTASRSKPDRGFTVIRYDVLNQAGERVMSYTSTHMLRRRAA